MTKSSLLPCPISEAIKMLALASRAYSPNSKQRWIDKAQELLRPLTLCPALGEDGRTEELAAEIWAASQLLPNEGIEDGVKRISAILSANVLRVKG